MKRISVRIAAVIIVMFSMFIMIPDVRAESRGQNQGCRNTIQVILASSTETGEPIITGSPANLMIFHTGQGPIKDVHLLIIVDEPTYNGLGSIIINNSIVLYKNDFIEVTNQKIGFGNCEYNINAIKGKLGVQEGNIYYNFTHFVDEITKNPKYFTIEVYSCSTNVLVLALGKLDSDAFNACSSFSKSTFIVPEVATLALTTASFLGAGSFYLIKRRNKSH